MDYNIHKICRVCLEEGALTSIYSTEFAMMPSTMMMMCAKIRVFKTDGLPAVICNNCIYRLGVAYHFKQECENSDIRLRQYLGLPDRLYGYCDAETNTDSLQHDIRTFTEINKNFDSDEEDAADAQKKKSKRKHRYERKPQEEHKKRGPKPLPKLPQTCYDCNKTFKCSAQLQMHIRTHTGEKPFVCNYCPRRFAQKYNLQIHERTHTGERPFQCEICSKQFSALGNFQSHQKIHTGIRDQCCPVCQKAFYSAGDLSKHMITHTGMKNHHCDVCGKAFSRQRDMQAHKRKMHALQESLAISEEDDAVDTTDHVSANVDENFKCPDCDKEFSSAISLSTHFRSHSGSNLLSLPLPGQIHQHAHPHYSLSHEALHHSHHHLHMVGPSAATSAATNSLIPPAPQPIAPTVLNGTMPLNVTATTNSSSTAVTTLGMAMSNAAMAHILAPPPPPPPPLPTPTSQNAISMMHAAQRLHPY